MVHTIGGVGCARLGAYHTLQPVKICGLVLALDSQGITLGHGSIRLAFRVLSDIAKLGNHLVQFLVLCLKGPYEIVLRKV